MVEHSAMEVAQAMFARDRASQALGMNILSCGPGRAVLTMKVRPDMVNGLDVCHGGLIFTLADSTFAFACNSHNHNTVAAGCSIEFLAPAKLDDTLTATGVERFQRGRQGVYDIEVRNQNDEIVALFRGKSARVSGHVIG